MKIWHLFLSKLLSEEGVTTVGTIMGTEYYASPEQRNTPGDVDARSDLYSLGVCMYRLLSNSGMPVGNFPSLNEINPELPPEFDSLLMRCLEVNRDERINSVEEVAGHLDAIIVGQIGS